MGTKIAVMGVPLTAAVTAPLDAVVQNPIKPMFSTGCDLFPDW